MHEIVIAIMIGFGVFSGIFSLRTEVEKGLFLYTILSSVFFAVATYLILRR